MDSQRSPASVRTRLAPSALVGQVIIVTGAEAGIGREVARACAWLGARVVVAELSAAGRETTEQIMLAGGAARFVPTDVADEDAVAALVAATLAAYGPPTALINNATLNQPAPLAATSLALFERTLAVNLRGPFLTCRAVLPHMIAAGTGLIVNMVSTGAAPAMGAYLASKQGLLSLTQSLAAELGAGAVHVVALATGLVDTPGLRDATGNLAQHLSLAPWRRFNASLHPAYTGAMPAEDAGAAVAYLLSTGGADDHGKLVNSYTLLQRAGLITPSAPGLTSANTCPCTMGEAAHLARALSEQIHDTSAETETGQLHAHTGLSLNDWDTTIGDLERQLADLEEGGQLVNEALHTRLERLFDGLMHLRDYYSRLPTATAQFSADQELLRQVGQTSARRARLIDDLLTALGRM